jgi:carbamate kinase
MPIPEGIVLALGGNSITRTGEAGTIAQQWAHTDETTAEIADLWGRERWPLIITHGNGPQLGRILLRSELASKELDPLSIDIAVSDSEAGMGYMIQQLLQNHLRRRGLPTDVITLITQVEIDGGDPAFETPTKPIGLFYSEEQARELSQFRDWQMAEDAGRGWRRVVASPRPRRIVEIEAIERLVNGGHIAIAVGGGGIPVVREVDGTLHGRECVIDKDLASALLAVDLGIRRLVIVTGVPRVCLDWGKPTQREVSRLSASEAEVHLRAGQFHVGSMAPKISAAVAVARAGGTTVVTQPGEIAAALAGEAGTWIVPD